MNDIARTAYLINAIHQADGFVYEEFISAAGIRGNFKIDLPAALRRNPEAQGIFAGAIAEDLRDTDVIVATGGAVGLSKAVTDITGKPRAVITPVAVRGVKNFRLCDHAIELFKDEPRIGVIEDVSSTFGTVQKMLAQTGIGPLVTKVAVGWRRGRPAPVGMTSAQLDEQNQKFQFRDLYEHELGVPVSQVIDRYLPLWLPTRLMIRSWLPELAE